MSRRSRRNVKRYSGYQPTAYLGYKRSRVDYPAGRTLYVQTLLPLSVARVARKKTYAYPYPSQIRKRGRAVRFPLLRNKEKMVSTVVKIKLPRRLPEVRGSYVSLADGRLNIHSTNQLRRLEDAQERNRRRYSEHKGHKRKARYGQLDSGGSLRFGSVAESYRRGYSIDKISDAALVARTLGGIR